MIFLFFFFLKVKAEFAFTRLHCVFFYKTALSEATELPSERVRNGRRRTMGDHRGARPNGPAGHTPTQLSSRMYSCRHLHEEKLSYREQMQNYAFVDVDLPAWR